MTRKRSSRRSSLPPRDKILREPKSLKREYARYFVFLPSLPCNTDTFSLEQPSPLEWFPSETTYGIGSQLMPS